MPAGLIIAESRQISVTRGHRARRLVEVRQLCFDTVIRIIENGKTPIISLFNIYRNRWYSALGYFSFNNDTELACFISVDIKFFTFVKVHLFDFSKLKTDGILPLGIPTSTITSNSHLLFPIIFKFYFFQGSPVSRCQT